jgi:hypothetical protein
VDQLLGPRVVLDHPWLTLAEAEEQVDHAEVQPGSGPVSVLPQQQADPLSGGWRNVCPPVEHLGYG